MADRSIKLILSANVQGLVSGLKTAQQAIQDTAKRSSDFVSRNEQNISHLSNVLGGMGLALTAGFGYAVKTFADFDAAMSSVAAATMTTGAELDSLRQAAIDAGAATSFSATEAAGAIENLAKAGISTADILNGGLTGALDLAAAGELDVAEAAEIAATAMTQFNLDGGDMAHIADLLAASAGKAQGDVTDMAQALKQSGLVASQFGLSIEETTGTLAAFASAGLLGSDAGTSLRTMLLRLGNPSKEAADEMERLGISAYDAATGGFVGMVGIAGQLEKALAPLPQAQRDAAMATIFGSDAIRSANVLYKEGAAGVQEWIGAVDDQGYAAEQAAMRLDNLKGDLEALSGSFESLILQSGSGANEWLRSMVQGAEGVVDAFSEIPAPVLNATTLLVGGGGLVALGIAGLAKLTVGINSTKAAITAMGISMKTAGLAAGALGAAIGIAAVGLTVWAQNAAEAKARTEEYQATLDNLGNTTDATMESINKALSTDQNNWLDNLFGKDMDTLIDRANRAGIAIEDLQGYIVGNEEAMRRVTDASRDYVAEGLDPTATQSEIAAQASRFLTGALDAESESLTNAEKAQAQKALADEEAGVAQEDLTAATAAGTGAIVDQSTAIGDLIDARNELAGVVLSERDAQRAYEAALDDATAALAENGATTDITTEKGRANAAALDNIAVANGRVVKAMHENGASQAQIQAQVQRSRDEFIAMASSMGISAGDAANLADKLDLIPGNYTAEVFADTDPAQAALDRFLAVARSQQIVIQARVNADPSYSPARAPSMIARSTGGWIPGAPSLRDSVPLLAAPGEFVVNSTQAQKYAGLLEAINSGKFSGNPGVHSAPASVSSSTTTHSSRTLSPTIVTRERVTERTIRNALHQADLLDPNR